MKQQREARATAHSCCIPFNSWTRDHKRWTRVGFVQLEFSTSWLKMAVEKCAFHSQVVNSWLPSRDHEFTSWMQSSIS